MLNRSPFAAPVAPDRATAALTVGGMMMMTIIITTTRTRGADG